MIKTLVLILLFLALALGWMWLRAGRFEAAAEAAFPADGQMVEIDTRRLHLKISGTGPPVVLIHGASGNLRDMTFRLAPALETRFTVIAVDRPGLGHSPAFNPKGESLSEQVALMGAALERLGFKRVYLLGQSFGGAVALQWALDRPDQVAGMVLVAAPSNVWPTGLDPLYKLNVNPVTGPLLRLAIASVVPQSVVDASLAEVFAPQPISPGYAERAGLALSLRRDQQRANALQVARLKEQVRAMVPRYGEIGVPVIALHGTADKVVHYDIHTRRLADQIRDIEEVKLEGEGHMPHQTRTGDVVDALVRLDEKAGLADARN